MRPWLSGTCHALLLPGYVQKLCARQPWVVSVFLGLAALTSFGLQG